MAILVILCCIGHCPQLYNLNGYNSKKVYILKDSIKTLSLVLTMCVCMEEPFILLVMKGSENDFLS